MRIKRNERIAGVPVLKIRDFFNRLNSADGNTFSQDRLCDLFHLSCEEGAQLIKELQDRRFIEETEGGYSLTLHGAALSIARCVPPINKEKADSLLADFMYRVREVNESDEYLYRVSGVWLFGSYIDDNATDYGDIDIAVELSRKIEDPSEHMRLNQEAVMEASERGKRFSTIFDQLDYTRRLVLLKLKNRNQYISLHTTSDGILELTKTIRIYP